MPAMRVAKWVSQCVSRMTLAVVLLGFGNVHAENNAHTFLMQTLDAEQVDMMNYVERGRWTIIMFWSTNCVLCEEQKPGLEAFHRQQFPDTAAIVGVAIDGYEMIGDIEKLNALHDPSYPNLVAYTDVYTRQYEELVGKRFKTTPTFLIFDDKAQFQGVQTGYLPLDKVSAMIASRD